MSADDCSETMSDLIAAERRSGMIAIVFGGFALVTCVVALWIG
jgi:hypothetical protein